MARPRSPGYELQRDELLAAAARLFAHQGYTATTMQQVAEAAGVGKATLYHYVRDKPALLAQIVGRHMARLEALVQSVAGEGLDAEAHLARLVERFMQAYAHAQHEHRVLTEDVRFLPEAEREAVLAAQRRVVQAFADAVAVLRPGLAAEGLAKPMAMLLFGMMNWTFTWLRAEGPLTHEALAPLIARLFVGGSAAVAGFRSPAG